MITTVTILDACNKQKTEIAASAGSDVPRTSAKDIPEALPQFARIITGIRRCGKSTLVQQDILTKSPDFFYLNFDEPALSEFTRKDFAVLDEAINTNWNIRNAIAFILMKYKSLTDGKCM